MRIPFNFFLPLLGLFLLAQKGASAAPVIQIQRHANCNLFDIKEPVQFQASVSGLVAAGGEVKAVATSYFGQSKTVKSSLTAFTPGQASPLTLDFGVMEPGYYELNVELELAGVKTVSKMMSFAVVSFVNRSAEEARKGGYRFGLKTFSLGAPGIWWRKGEVWNLAEVVDACTKLGLQWTRHQFNQGPNPEPGVISTDDLINKHAMNVVLKVEGFPDDCFDVARYGTLEEWKAKKKTKSPNRCTVPMKEPYQKWLRGEIAKITPSQTIFEIGNEVWEYMTAEEFAEWAQMAREVIKEVRPDAKVGAEPGSGDYGRRFLKAGGMDHMEIWYEHPYSFTPLPEHRIRGYLRNYREILKRRTGHDFELYVTEYGWPIAPQDTRKNSVSEKVQAQRTTRESLMLYAEDAKTLIPHWMGDREQDPKEREHWFGFFRLNQQPLPVVVAHATCARMIDSGKFVGDLWQGEGIGAMLFERGGIYTLAVWTAEVDRQARIDVGVPEITVVDMMGGKKKMPSSQGTVQLKLNGDVTYLVGVSPGLASKVAPAGANLNPDLWSKREGSFDIPRTAVAPLVEGDLADWAGVAPIELKSMATSLPAGSGQLMLRWDKEYIYAALAIKGAKPGSKEEVELSLGVRPDRQVDMGSTTLFDFDFKIKHAGNGKDTLTVENADFDKNVEVAASNDSSGIRWASKTDDGGWTLELAIPLKFLRDMPAPVDGLKLSGAVSVKDVETKKVLLALGDEKARLWPYLVLKETK